MNSLTISDINIIKYIKLTNNIKLIKATEQLLLLKPKLLLKSFLQNILQDYDKTCKYFSMFYEQLFMKIKLYNFHRQVFELDIS